MSFLSGRTSLTTVQTADIAAGAITTAKIAANNVDSTLTKDALIGDYTEVTIATGDSLLLGDVNDSGNTKRDTVQGLLDLAGGGFTQGTVQATTSGTAFTFGSIPTGTQMIVINFFGVSLSATLDIAVTIGDSGGLETSGYLSEGKYIDGSSTTHEVGSTSYFIMDMQDQPFQLHGSMFLTLQNAAAFNWSSSHCTYGENGVVNFGGGTKSLSAELTQVSISGGTFDAGSLNIMYQ